MVTPILVAILLAAQPHAAIRSWSEPPSVGGHARLVDATATRPVFRPLRHPGAARLAGQQSPAPLFADEAPLTLTLRADFGALRDDRAEDPEERPAQLTFAGPDGLLTLDIDVRPRGNFRRDPAVCTFTPLRLDLPRRALAGTVFDGQNRLKMVTPCRPGPSRYQDLVLVEYLLYRAYGLVTDAAFHVRLIHATFEDAGGAADPFTAYGFLIEHADAVAERLGAEVLEIPEGSVVRPAFLEATAAVRAALFQYMIGNGDWSDVAGHNVELFATEAGPVLPVPYDFDFSGAVDAPYAAPPPDLGLRDVRDRLYRGWCFPGIDTTALLDRFRAAQAPWEALVAGFEPLSEGRRGNLTSYTRGFFEDVATDERAERRMLRDCRPLS